MKIPYSEKGICIDLILNEHKGANVFEIIDIAKEVLDINLHISDVLSYLEVTEDFEKESLKIEQNLSEYE